MQTIAVPRKEKLLNNNLALFVFAAVTVFLTRLPFVNAGYGLDADAWRVIRVAQTIATTGQYEASRLPGYPFQEYVYSLVWEYGPLGTNLVTALLSAFGVAFFTLSMKELGLKDFLITGIVLAFIPVVFINSTNAMDYVWGMAFMLAGLYFVITRRPIVAGLLIGLAIGTRITSGAVLAPLILLIIAQNRWRTNLNHLLRFILPALIIGALAYLPVYVRYGAGFFTFHEPRQAVPLSRVVMNLSENVWGSIGSTAVSIAIIALTGKFITQRDFRWGNEKVLSMQPSIAWAWLVAIVIYVAAFLRLPLDAGYLIPAVPFVLLIFAGTLQRKLLLLVALMLMISPFLLNFDRSGLDLKGPILVNHERRVNDLHYADAIIATLQAQRTGKIVLIAGPFKEVLKNVGESTGVPEQLRLIYLLDESELERYVDSGYTVFYLPRIVNDNMRAHNLDLRNTRAIPLVVD